MNRKLGSKTTQSTQQSVAGGGILYKRLAFHATSQALCLAGQVAGWIHTFMLYVSPWNSSLFQQIYLIT